MDRVRERKIRSDKRVDSKPTVRIELKDTLYRLSYITNLPVKDVCEKLCIAVLDDKKSIDYLAKYFKREIFFRNTLYRGHLKNPSIKRRDEGETERITTRFTRYIYEYISILSYGLDCSRSRVVALLLEISVHDIRFINNYVKDYLKDELTDAQMRDLRRLMSDVNKLNSSHHSWASLLAYIVDEVSTPIMRAKDAVNEFFEKSNHDT